MRNAIRFLSRPGMGSDECVQARKGLVPREKSLSERGTEEKRTRVSGLSSSRFLLCPSPPPPSSSSSPSSPSRRTEPVEHSPSVAVSTYFAFIVAPSGICPSSIDGNRSMIERPFSQQTAAFHETPNWRISRTVKYIFHGVPPAFLLTEIRCLSA